MEFSEKLQELRKEKGLTQQDLANALFVSRTAISKWESGRGYPNIESLKDIATYFSVSIDELLSSNEVLSIAENDQKEKGARFQNLLFGWLDVSMILLLFLPFFAERVETGVQSVSLLTLMRSWRFLELFYLLSVCGMALCGVFTLALQNVEWSLWQKSKRAISMSMNVCTIGLFIVGLQPYSAVFVFLSFIIKCILQIKRR